jgi:ElaB/YqjD/DUF883 family membrane-anchored ribosome-binding protein
MKGNRMSTTSERLGKQATTMKKDLEEMSGTVRDAAQEQFDQASERASELCAEGRDKVHGLACACEQYISQRPLRSVLTAAGIAWLLGRFWKRR